MLSVTRNPAIWLHPGLVNQAPGTNSAMQFEQNEAINVIKVHSHNNNRYKLDLYRLDSIFDNGIDLCRDSLC
jgi:hypothetical protein